MNEEFGYQTKATDWGNNETRATETMNHFDGGGGRTVIRVVGGSGVPDPDGGRKLVGVLVSYSANLSGEIYKVYEGVTTIGRDRTCDVSFPNDQNMSSRHLSIQYIAAKGAFRASEMGQGSSNGTYVNGKIYVLGDIIDLKTNDVVVIGSTKLIFMAIPEF